MTRRVKELHQAVPGAYAELHRADALELGVNSGDTIRLVSRRGEVELTARVEERGHSSRGVVFVPFFDETLLINKLTLDAHCPISKQPDFKKCAARVKRPNGGKAT